MPATTAKNKKPSRAGNYVINFLNFSLKNIILDKHAFIKSLA